MAQHVLVFVVTMSQPFGAVGLEQAAAARSAAAEISRVTVRRRVIGVASVGSV
jgi:hypothetical protein